MITTTHSGRLEMKNWFRAPALILCLVLVAVGLSACGSGVKFVRVDPVEFPPKSDSAQIGIFDGAVSTPHIVIGTLTARKQMDAKFDDSSTYDELLVALKKHARKVGADALIEVRPVTSEGGGLKSNVEISAVAIRYLERQSTITAQTSR